MSERQIDWARVNKAIAVHLFGWRTERALGKWFGWPPSGGYGQPVHNYSDNWEGMDEVVEAMDARRFRSSIDYGPRWNEPIYAHRAWFYKYDFKESREKQEGSATADTAPRAVALACLRALNVEVPHCE